MIVKPQSKVVFSTLFFYKPDVSLDWLRFMTRAVEGYLGRRDDISIVIICTNNAPDDNIAEIEDFVRRTINSDHFAIHLTTSSYNLGFGGGHNANLFSDMASDANYFVVINNDIRFPHLNWLDNAIQVLDTDIKVGAVGALGVPGELDSIFAISQPVRSRPPIIDYAEASMLVLRPEAFRSVGGFRQEIAYAMYEDADLSLRLRQRGWRLEFIDMPHEHFRGSSTGVLSPQHFQYLHESNRAFFLSRWNGYLQHRSITARAFVDLSADGVGDVVFSYAPFCSFLREARRENLDVTVGLRGKKMNFLFSRLDVTILDTTEFASTFEIEAKGFDTLLWPSRVVHTAPFHSQQLIAAALNLRTFDKISLELKSHYQSDSSRRERDRLLGFSSAEHDYAVVHLDSQRTTFEGRAVPFSIYWSALELLAERFSIVLVGQKSSVGLDLEADQLESFIAERKVIDLRNSTVEEMFLAIAGASRFVGIDSGPMHMAQQFEVPSFVVFGATHSLTKIINKSLTYVVTHPGLDCLGCYHWVFQPSYSYCLRRDQACVRALDRDFLADHMGRFLEGQSCDWDAQEQRLAALQTQWLAQQMHHPVMRNPLLQVSDTQELRILNDMSIFMLSKIDQISKERYAASERRYREFANRLGDRERTFLNRNARLEQELKELQLSSSIGRAAAAAKSIFQPAANRDKTHISLDAQSKLEKITANIAVERTKDGVVFNCRKDPMLLLPRIDVPVGRDLQLDIELDTAMDIPVQVFWAATAGAFKESDSVRRTLRHEIGKAQMFIKPDFSPIFLRVDPGDGGERYRFKSLKVTG